MRPGTLMAVASTAVLTLAASAQAEAFKQDFAIAYEIDDATGDVRHSLLGTYTAAISCSAGWTQRDLLRENVDMPILEPISVTSPSAAPNAAAHTIRYAVSLGQGMLRLLEVKNATRSVDLLYSCASPVIDGGPALHPTRGHQATTFAAHATQSACKPTHEGGGRGLAPGEFDFKGPERAYRVNVTDDGLCLRLTAMGMLADAACVDAPRACVPFSGRIQASVLADDLVTPDVDVAVGGIACSFMFVGGYCWSGNFTGSTQGGPSQPDPPTWRACACDAQVVPRVFTPQSIVPAPVSAVGSWGVLVHRAPGA